MEKKKHSSSSETAISSDEKKIPKDVMTGLPSGQRIPKSDLRMDACGTVDELNSYIGLLVTELPSVLHEDLYNIQRRLFAIGAYIVGVEKPEGLPTEVDVESLKQQISFFKGQGAEVHSFVLPGGCHSASLSHVCRTVCRRAERTAVALEAYKVVPFLNRLSTYFFYLALYLNIIHKNEEIKL